MEDAAAAHVEGVGTGWPGDLYAQRAALAEEDRAHLDRVRRFMEDRVAPVIDAHWAAATFPHDLIPDLRRARPRLPLLSGARLRRPAACR